VNVVEFQNVERAFSAGSRIGPLSFSLSEKQVTVFLGPNGAGKTTTFKLLLGLRSPTAGTVRLWGEKAGSKNVRSRVGYTSQDLTYPAHLTAEEILNLVTSHFEFPTSSAELRERFALEKIWRKQLGGFSGGERRRLGLACALIGKPRLLVLDEPTTGLDVDGKKLLWSEITKFRDDGGTVLFSTHDISEASMVGDRVLLIDGGQIKIDGSMDEILGPLDYKRLRYTQNGTVTERISHQSDADVKALFQSSDAVTNLEIRRLSLEEALVMYRKEP